MPKHEDCFRQARRESGVITARADGQDVPLVLRLADVGKTCKNADTFSNDAPLMIVLHSEAHVRDVRQLPIETDPPDHTDYRALVEPIYRRPQQSQYQETMRALVASMITAASRHEEIETESSYQRKVGYKTARLRFLPHANQ